MRSCSWALTNSGHEESARLRDSPAFDVRGGVLRENSERNRLTGEVVPRLQRDRRRQAGENAYGERGSLLTGGTQATFYESIDHEAATDVDCHRSEE